MMPNHIPPLELIEKTVKETLEILDAAKGIPGFIRKDLDRYEKECTRIPELVREGRLKIAVVGVIKSGKSTLVNSLTGKDLVQRGAGVVTSITTRIRKGKKNQACLFLKSWDEINAQLRNALEMFPTGTGEDVRPDLFDIRKIKDREYLQKAYEDLNQGIPVSGDQIRPEILLMKYALNGFDFCKDLVQADESTLCFSVNQFDTHKEFTSDPARAFYVKDACLEVYGKAVEQGIEIADCQGADSMDPAQLFQVLRYLESANFIIYCISSRNGLRQADIMFLRRIKRLGRLDNVLFVNNCDFSEHENLDDLVKIENEIRENLKFLDISPEIFSISALFNLFSAMAPRLKKRDMGRLELWKAEKEMVGYCEKNTRRFNTAFKKRIENDMQLLLVANHLKRLGMILDHLEHQAETGFELLSSDNSVQERTRRSFESLLQNAARLENIVANSVDGAVKGLREEISSNFNYIFKQDSQSVVKDTSAFVKTITADVDAFRPMVTESSFNKILYLLFQDVKRQLDLFVIETVRPRLSKVIALQEEKISSYFQSLLNTYQVELAGEGMTGADDTRLEFTGSGHTDTMDVENIKKILGLKIPDRIFRAEFTPMLKASVFADFSIHTVLQIVKSIFNKSGKVSFSPGLIRAVGTMKKETVKALNSQFDECRQIIETEFINPLIDACERDFKEKIKHRFQKYTDYKREMENMILLEQSEKKEQRKKITELRKRIQVARKDISAVGEIM